MINILFIEILLIIVIKFIKNIKNKIKNKSNKIYKIKGEYLTRIGNCLSCHTVRGGKPFSGGLSIKTIFGILNIPNITNDKKWGIGKINLKNFIKIIRNGSHKNNFLYPLFPYINYSKIKKSDIKNIFFFLKKIKSKNLLNKKNNINFPIKYKKILIGWRILFFKIKKKIKKKYKSNIKRGKYLTTSLGHCEMCHTKINNIGKLNKNFKYKGKTNIEGWKSTNINNENEGIKEITENQIFKILKYGIIKNKTINGVMCEIVNKSLQYVNNNDLISISRFLKSKINKTKIFKIKIKVKKNNYKKIKKVYKKICFDCHGKLNLGNFPIYAKILKKNKNLEYIKNIKNIFKKNNLINTRKNKYVAIMPKINIKLKKIKNYININNNLIKN